MIFDLACVVEETTPETVKARDSTPVAAPPTRDVGIAIGVYSHDPGCTEVMRTAGVDDSVDVAIAAEKGGRSDTASLAESRRAWASVTNVVW